MTSGVFFAPGEPALDVADRETAVTRRRTDAPLAVQRPGLTGRICCLTHAADTSGYGLLKTATLRQSGRLVVFTGGMSGFDPFYLSHLFAR